MNPCKYEEDIILSRDHVQQAKAWHITIVMIAGGFILQAAIVAAVILNDHFKVNLLWESHHVEIAQSKSFIGIDTADASEDCITPAKQTAIIKSREHK